jgi:hypothetical protein
MPLLTPGEYEDLPDDLKQQLAAIQQQRQPWFDVKSDAFERCHGPLLNGQVGADGRPLSCWDWEAHS